MDTTTAETLRTSIPDDRIVIAESGVREPALLRRWRALGFDAALIGEDLMRAGTDAAAVTRSGRRVRVGRRACPARARIRPRTAGCRWSRSVA